MPITVQTLAKPSQKKKKKKKIKRPSSAHRVGLRIDRKGKLFYLNLSRTSSLDDLSQTPLASTNDGVLILERVLQVFKWPLNYIDNCQIDFQTTCHAVDLLLSMLV